jgi:hypothetical protein
MFRSRNAPFLALTKSVVTMVRAIKEYLTLSSACRETA